MKLSPKARLLRYWQIALLIILGTALLTACSAAQTLTPFVPSGEVDLAGWETAYPVQYDQWAGSVHGEAYLSGDTNAPTCNDCHEAPAQGEEIVTTALHLETPARCARCHADSEMMAGLWDCRRCGRDLSGRLPRHHHPILRGDRPKRHPRRSSLLGLPWFARSLCSR